ncbi:MAG: EAL domain-containing protein [Oceanospirillaceae bacterium]
MSKTPYLLSFGLLLIMTLSIISSVMLFKRISNLEVSADKAQLVFYMRQYQYELSRANNAFLAAYSPVTVTNGVQSFTKWFDILWSRVDQMGAGRQGSLIVADEFKVTVLKNDIKRIDDLLFTGQTVTHENINQVHVIFKRLVSEAHNYQLSRSLLNRETAIVHQVESYQSYRHSVFYIIATFILGLVMVFYLIRNNKKLLQLRWTLEERVYKSTKDLRESNNELKSAIEKHKETELELISSQLSDEQAREKILYQANFDSLTKLANRNLFLERFSQSLKRAQRNDTLVGLLFLDLDRFKHINDTLGHSIGDELLQEASKRLVDVLRENDTAARFGGDEFAIILSDVTELKSIDIIVQRILKSLASPFRLSGNDAFVSASIGITIYPEDGNNCETLLRKADSAMYKAKALGKNNSQYFTQQMDVEANQRRELEKALYKAVENNEFYLNFQPIVNTRKQSITGAEALIRWNHPKLGTVSPADFIPLAEEVGLILDIGEWVLHQACLTAATWQTTANGPLNIAVNISSRQFQSTDVALLIEDALKESGLAAQRLVIEITESLLMADDENVMKQLNNIRDMGVALAIDDFGTGFSSLSYLKKFPITTLKIDQSFIKDINIDSSDDELIKGIISMANSLNLNVVAEGVETKAQSSFLLENSCFNMQGYYYSKPLSDQKFIEVLNSNIFYSVQNTHSLSTSTPIH